ncbi:MAG: hypothetical protein KF773_20410 [Deltaproteobacteria bacterium]|nr:hypothetical protein [Deltaproteobacteria bacterium]
MPSANKYFDTPAEAPEHPKIRAWSGWKTNAQRVELELLRPREGLGFRTPRMFVTFYAADGTVYRQDESEWELELDSWLLKQQVKARDEANETLRFALRLKAAFRPIAIRYGDGYFNSVLVHQLRGGPFGGVEPLAEVLGAIHEYEAAGGSKFDCEQLIDFEIKVAAHALLSLYANDRAVAERILIAALAQYLDERFHVTERRQLGFG